MGVRIAATVRHNDVEKVGCTNEGASLGTGQQVSEPAPLSEGALRRLREAAAAPDADAELAELVRALADFEARRAADAAAAAKARPSQSRPAGRPTIRTHVVARRVGMVLVIGALASTSAIALARSGGPRPAAGTGTPTHQIVLSGSPSGHATTAPRSGSSTSARTGSTGTNPGVNPGATPGAGPAASATSTGAAVPVGTATATATGSAAPNGSPSASGSSGSGNRSMFVGLCNAYAHGGLSIKSAVYAKLAAAAGGADKITAYCDALTAPTSTPAGTSQASRGRGRGRKP